MDPLYFYGKVIDIKNLKESVKMYPTYNFAYEFAYTVRLYIKDTTTINKNGIELDGDYFVNIKIKIASLVHNNVKINDYVLCHILKRRTIEDYKEDACYLCDSTMISNYTKCSIKFLNLIRRLRHKMKCEIVFHPSNIDFTNFISSDKIVFVE